MDAPLIARVATLFDDPILFQWARRYYRQDCLGEQEREVLAAAWFDDAHIKHWLDQNDPVILKKLFRDLEPARFARFTKELAANWATWPADLAAPCARILCQLDPALADACFCEYVNAQKNLSSDYLAAIASNLTQLPPEFGLEFINLVAPFLEQGRAHTYAFLVRDFIKTAALHQHTILPYLLDESFAASPHSENIVTGLAQGLFDHSAFADQCFGINKGWGCASFQHLALLFDEAAPLAEMDQVLKADQPLASAMALLAQHQQTHPTVRLWLETIGACASSKEEKYAMPLAILALSALAFAFERAALDTNEWTLAELVDVLALDCQQHRHVEALAAAISTWPKEQVVPALTEKLAETKASWGALAVVNLMGKLAWPEFVPTLVDCLGASCGDFLCEAAKAALAKLNPLACQTLIEQWDALDSSQKIYGGTVLAVHAGPIVADFLLARGEALMADDLEAWNSLAINTIDQRLLELIRCHLHRQQYLIDNAYYIQCRLLAQNEAGLAPVLERINKEHARQDRAMARFENKADDAPYTINLHLRCTTCNGKNHYEVKRVFVALPGASLNYLLADEFACASCGESSDFEFENEANLAIMGELMVSMGQMQSDKPYLGPLVPQPNVDWLGKLIPIQEALVRLQTQLKAKPDDWLSWFRLGNVMRGLCRPHKANECFARSHQLNPLFLEVTINYANGLVWAKRDGEAFEVLQQSLALRDRWYIHSALPREKHSEFADLYNALRKQLGRTDLPPLAALPPQSQAKAGRNDPCPCGSGKKFKKCCMP